MENLKLGSDFFEIQCPCCNGKLVVSRVSGKVVKSEAHKKGPAKFDDFLAKQKSRSEDLAKKFEKSREESHQRIARIQEKIEHAKESLDLTEDQIREARERENKLRD